MTKASQFWRIKVILLGETECYWSLLLWLFFGWFDLAFLLLWEVFVCFLVGLFVCFCYVPFMTYSNQNPSSAILQESLPPISKSIGSLIHVFGFRPKAETSPCFFFQNQVQKILWEILFNYVPCTINLCRMITSLKESWSSHCLAQVKLLILIVFFLLVIVLFLLIV